MTRVLIVDDELCWRDRLGSELQRNGYTFDVAEDGVVALECLASGSYDLVLLDIMLPRMDGFEVLARMRKNPELADIPVVLLVPKPADDSFDGYVGHPAKLTVRKDRLDDFPAFVRGLRSLISSEGECPSG